MSFEIPWIALSGFMWSWKSTVWKALAWKIPSSSFVDVDKIIREDFIQMPIWDFIWKYWMPKFREVESQVIAEILWKDFWETFQVISLWWWAVTVSQNVKAIKEKSLKLVYLDVPFDIIAQRLREDNDWNKDRVPFDEWFFLWLYDDRQEIYRSTADVVVSNIWDIENVVDEILWGLKIAA